MQGKSGSKIVVLGGLAPLAERVKELAMAAKTLVDADHYGEVIAHLSDALAEIALGYAEARGIDVEGIKVDVEAGFVVLTLGEGVEDG